MSIEVELGTTVADFATVVADLLDDLNDNAVTVLADRKQLDLVADLLTVQSRSPTESQYFFGWRYSNHLTAAFDGDVFVVTPTGWANLLGDWGGTSPALPVSVPSRRYWHDL